MTDRVGEAELARRLGRGDPELPLGGSDGGHAADEDGPVDRVRRIGDRTEEPSRKPGVLVADGPRPAVDWQEVVCRRRRRGGGAGTDECGLRTVRTDSRRRCGSRRRRAEKQHEQRRQKQGQEDPGCETLSSVPAAAARAHAKHHAAH